jgi:single-strand DNA-binding protein
MYNYFMLIGRIVNDIEVKEYEGGKRVVKLCLMVTRPFKNFEGNYESDFINVSLWEYMADLAQERLKKDDKIGIKGRITPRKVTLQDGATISVMDLIGERVMFFDLPYQNSQVEG